MKFNAPRMTLITGLAMALNLNWSEQSEGAEPKTKKTITLAKAQLSTNPAPSPGASISGAPSFIPVPLTPVPDPLSGNSTLNPQPIISGPSPVTTVPMQLGTQPSLAPAARPPLGLFYGEQERIDSIRNPSPRPLPPTNYSGSAPIIQPPSRSPGVPFESHPPSDGLPLNMDSSVVAGAPHEIMPHYGAVDRFGYAPPPGTLGQTYKRRSRPIEENKHPRVGVVEVNLPEGVDVTAKGLKTKWTGKVWRLESDSLIPGIPHIYEVHASWGEGTQPQVRTVRLIMGRIVDLDF